MANRYRQRPSSSGPERSALQRARGVLVLIVKSVLAGLLLAVGLFLLALFLPGIIHWFLWWCVSPEGGWIEDRRRKGRARRRIRSWWRRMWT